MDKIGEYVNVVIPTFKRADALHGIDYFEYARYVLPESQRDEYLKVLSPDRIICCPDKDDGNIARKRNWILRNVSRPLLMIDDDVKCLVHSERGAQHIKLNKQEAEAVIVHGFNLACDWGVKVWGINLNTDGRNYQQYKPFALTQPVLGPFMGHLDHGLIYDERMDTKDDYDMSLQVLCNYKKILRLNKFAYVCEHGLNQGGIVGSRTWEREVAACEAIMRKWGKSVIMYNTRNPRRLGDLLNGRVNVPIGAV